MKRPGPAALHSLPGPTDIARVELDNGIVVLCRANFNSPSVVVSGYLNAGALFDPDEKLGLADFTAAALLRGTRTHSFEQIHDAIESVGASLNFSAGTHTISFSGRALAEDLPLILNLLSESLRAPTFPKDHLERLRAQLLTGLAIRNQDTADMAALTFESIIYANHPYARPEDGHPETIRAITRKDIVDFHKKHFGPGGMAISIVGAIQPQKAVAAVRRVLGDWQNPKQPQQPELPPLAPITETIRRHVALPGKAQADIMIGTSGPRRTAPEYFATSLGNSVLGQFGMSGRIGDVVRERSGLAYYAYSSLSAGVGPGAWDISAGVNPANVEKTIDLIRKEIKRFVRNGVTEEELQDSKDNFIGRLPLSLESNAGVANALLNIERYQLGLDYYRQYPDRIRAVTRDQVNAAARQYLHPDKLAIATAGPK